MEVFGTQSADSQQREGARHALFRPRRRLTAGCIGTVLAATVVFAVIAWGLWRTVGKLLSDTGNPGPGEVTSAPGRVGSAPGGGRQLFVAGPMQWNNDAWMVVRSPGGNAESYAEALRLVERAVQEEPNNGYYLNTLGVAQYRLGRYAEALATLTRSEKLNATKSGSHPADLAFLAMTRHQLGQEDEAKAALALLRDYATDPRRFRDRESRDFLHEAEELIGAGAAARPD